MRTTIDLDPSLLERLRADAHREGVSFRALLHRVIQRGLEPPDAGAEPAYTAPSFAMGPVHEGVDLVKALQLADTLEDEAIVRKLAERR